MHPSDILLLHEEYIWYISILNEQKNVCSWVGWKSYWYDKNVFDMYCYPKDLLDLHSDTNHSVAKISSTIWIRLYTNICKSETHVSKEIYLGHVWRKFEYSQELSRKMLHICIWHNEHNAWIIM